MRTITIAKRVISSVEPESPGTSDAETLESDSAVGVAVKSCVSGKGRVSARLANDIARPNRVQNTKRMTFDFGFIVFS